MVHINRYALSPVVDARTARTVRREGVSGILPVTVGKDFEEEDVIV